MTVVEIVVYGVFSGLVGGGLASIGTFLLIERSSKKIQANIKEQAKKMSEEMKLAGLNDINSSLMQNVGSNKNWH